MVALAQLVTVRDNQRQESFAESRYTRTTEFAQLVKRYLDERNGVPPANIASLVATPGFEDASQYLNSSGPHGEGPFLFVVPLTRNGNSFHRVIVYDTPIDNSISATDYLSQTFNKCGSTSASQVGDWCGDPQGVWWMTETLDRIPDELAKERLQQQQTLQKFAKAYSFVDVNRQVFPDPGLGNDSAVTLISRLTSYNLTATTCAGTWMWQKVPLSCEDLYTIWGEPRIYNYKNEDQIALYAESPWNEGGQKILVASQLDSRRN